MVRGKASIANIKDLNKYPTICIELWSITHPRYECHLKSRGILNCAITFLRITYNFCLTDDKTHEQKGRNPYRI